MRLIQVLIVVIMLFIEINFKENLERIKKDISDAK